jgi:hypothetical protein
LLCFTGFTSAFSSENESGVEALVELLFLLDFFEQEPVKAAISSSGMKMIFFIALPESKIEQKQV